MQKVSEGEADFGYNARTDKYENLMAAGVIDPAKVTRVALENAASIAGMFLTTECVIADKKEEPRTRNASTWHGRHGRHDVKKTYHQTKSHCKPAMAFLSPTDTECVINPPIKTANYTTQKFHDNPT